MRQNHLNTIGYEGATLEDFVRTLRLADVGTVVDIRERAQSRRKGFSKTALSQRLRMDGMNYIHLRELGDPKPGREAARAGDWGRFQAIYSQIIKTSEAQRALSEIEMMLKQDQSLALLCYERDHKTCHRKIVSDIIESRTRDKARHLGVQAFGSDTRTHRRVLHPGEGATASV